MEIKQMDAAGIAHMIAAEGLKLTPYLDTVGVPTIGIGCTYYENGTKVKISDPQITKDRAIELFKNVLKHYELAVYSTTRDDINQNQFNALVSFCYNIGVGGFKGSTVLRKVNANPNDKSIADAFMMWTKNKELKGRRQKEVALYFS